MHHRPFPPPSPSPATPLDPGVPLDFPFGLDLSALNSARSSFGTPEGFYQYGTSPSAFHLNDGTGGSGAIALPSAMPVRSNSRLSSLSGLSQGDNLAHLLSQPATLNGFTVPTDTVNGSRRERSDSLMLAQAFNSAPIQMQMPMNSSMPFSSLNYLTPQLPANHLSLPNNNNNNQFNRYANAGFNAATTSIINSGNSTFGSGDGFAAPIMFDITNSNDQAPQLTLLPGPAMADSSSLNNASLSQPANMAAPSTVSNFPFAESNHTDSTASSSSFTMSGVGRLPLSRHASNDTDQVSLASFGLNNSNNNNSGNPSTPRTPSFPPAPAGLQQGLTTAIQSLFSRIGNSSMNGDVNSASNTTTAAPQQQPQQPQQGSAQLTSAQAMLMRELVNTLRTQAKLQKQREFLITQLQSTGANVPVFEDSPSVGIFPPTTTTNPADPFFSASSFADDLSLSSSAVGRGAASGRSNAILSGVEYAELMRQLNPPTNIGDPYCDLKNARVVIANSPAKKATLSHLDIHPASTSPPATQSHLASSTASTPKPQPKQEAAKNEEAAEEEEEEGEQEQEQEQEEEEHEEEEAQRESEGAANDEEMSRESEEESPKTKSKPVAPTRTRPQRNAKRKFEPVETDVREPISKSSRSKPVTKRKPLVQGPHVSEIVCGIVDPSVKDVKAADVRQFKMYSEFFGREVDVFTAVNDPERRPLFQTNELARLLNCTNNAVAMYLSRRKHRPGSGIFQASAIWYKRQCRRDIRSKGYFISLEVCRKFRMYRESRDRLNPPN